MTSEKQPKSSRSVEPEQWSVAETVVGQLQECDHEWRLATLRSSRGRYSPGIHCLRCAALERITEEQWAAHGRRVERSKP